MSTPRSTITDRTPEAGDAPDSTDGSDRTDRAGTDATWSDLSPFGPPGPEPLLEALRVFGFDRLEPVLVSALAREATVLLIGRHGTAKSALLNRLAAALGLEHRHFNASLISFDDLLGFPVPDDDRAGLRYLRTPGDLWDAESVLLDEISRCRPETQNKLFSVVHERRVQGLELPHLRHRWAAMNPPPSDDDPDDADAYVGSLPLDPALADRFELVFEVPEFADLSARTRLRVLLDGDRPPARDAGERLRRAVDACRERLPAVERFRGEWVSAYVCAVVGPLAEAGLEISGRRAVALYRAVLGVLAAHEALGRDDDLPAAARLALGCALPHRATGREVPRAVLGAVHRAAVDTADLHQLSLVSEIRSERDPLRRIALCLHHADHLDRLDRSRLVADAFAALPTPRRYLASRHLTARLAAADLLDAPTLELVTAPMRKVLEFASDDVHNICRPRSWTPVWQACLKAVSRLDESDPDQAELANLVYTLAFVEDETFAPGTVVQADSEVRDALLGPLEEAV